MLAAAHAFERIGGLEPCLLCLRQREAYWMALSAAAAGLLLASARPELGRVVAALLAAIFLAGFAAAAFHVGVEQGWWRGPDACAVGGGVTAAAVARALDGTAAPAASCSEAAWRWLGVSMAGWNALIALSLAALGVASAARSRRRSSLIPAARRFHVG